MSNEAFPDVRLQIENRIARVTIDRPGVRNALRPETSEGLVGALAEARKHPEVRLLWLTGEGNAFCAGADLADHGKLFRQAGDRSENARVHITEVFHAIIRAVRDFPCPTMAVIPGAAVGFGFDLALACDLRVAAADAKVGPIFNHLGLVPDGGGSWTLPRLIGMTRAMEWVLTGETRRAAEVAEWGVFNRVVPLIELESAAQALADRIVAGAPRALTAARKLLYTAQSQAFPEALAAECEAQIEMLNSRDFGEGVAAWFEHRPPQFTGE